jgi:gamma-glutamyltranspeptidase/glutathione hydrolase
MPIFEKYSLNLLFVIVSGFLAACSSGSLKENPKQFPSPDPRVDVEKERRDNLPRQMETGVDSAFTSRFDGSTDSADRSRYLPFTSAQGGMVVSDDGEASECGAEILRKGGNAVDAAVATAFALSVSRPHFASIGGGGFLLFCPAPKAGDGQSDFVSGKKCQAMDYRETAPKGSFRDMYVQNGKGNTELSQAGALASAVPGTVAGLLQALKEWGRLPREKVMACAIRMARTGVRVSSNTEAGAVYRWKKMNAEAKRIFGDSTDTPLKPGAILVQYDLARVLESISRQGEKGFYKGWVARRLAKGLKDAGGIITQEDLESYHPVIRTPVEGSYRGQTVVSMPPPSSGGFLVIQMLQFAKLAEATQSFTEGPGSIHTLHAEAFSMDLAFADRAQYMGDPDFFKVPLAELLDSHYLASRWSIFNPEKVSEVSPGPKTEKFTKERIRLISRWLMPKVRP